MLITALPVEILEEILGHLRCREGRLRFRQLSLVSRAFVGPVQRHLFRTLFIDVIRHPPFEELLSFLRDAPSHIRNAVRHIKFYARNLRQRHAIHIADAVVTQRLVAALLALLPGATRLTLQFVRIASSAADEDDLARIGWGRDGRSLERLDIIETLSSFNDVPEEYISILSLFSTIQTLQVGGLGSIHPRFWPDCIKPALPGLNYSPVRGLRAQCVKLLDKCNPSWITLLSNTRTALGSVCGQEGPTLRELDAGYLAVSVTGALGELFRLGATSMRHIHLYLDELLHPEIPDAEERTALFRSMGTPSCRLETLTLHDIAGTLSRLRRMLDLMANIVSSLRHPVDQLVVRLGIRHPELRAEGTIVQELPCLWDALSTWVRNNHIGRAHVVLETPEPQLVTARGQREHVVARVVEDQLATLPIAPFVRSGSLTVEWDLVDRSSYSKSRMSKFWRRPVE